MNTVPPFMHESSRCLVFALAMVELPEVSELMVLLVVRGWWFSMIFSPIPGVFGRDIESSVLGA